tara:strand:- start:1150 stop:1533 length:384 start_codon:yes stop_codon:yes gene_type:complete
MKPITIIVILFLLVSGRVDRTKETENNIVTYKFVLTHLLDKKLTKDAYFFVGDMETWTLDFRNGRKITYRIISMNENNPLCGITARDSFGDTCDICITTSSNKGANIEFKYGSKRLTYKGYFSEKID